MIIGYAIWPRALEARFWGWSRFRAEDVLRTVELGERARKLPGVVAWKMPI
jgi:hypothetical protein